MKRLYMIFGLLGLILGISIFTLDEFISRAEVSGLDEDINIFDTPSPSVFYVRLILLSTTGASIGVLLVYIGKWFYKLMMKDSKK
jgi:hypothetical protein